MNVKYMGKSYDISLTKGIVPCVARRIPKAFNITASDVAISIVAYLATPKGIRDSARRAYANGDALSPQRVAENSPTILLEYDGRYIQDSTVAYITRRLFELDSCGIITL